MPSVKSLPGGRAPIRDATRNHSRFLDGTLRDEELPTTHPSRDVDPEREEAGQAGESQADAAETRMRRALGLANDQPVRNGAPAEPIRRLGLRPRSPEVSPSGRTTRRFVQDGEVPVTVVRGRWTEAQSANQPVVNRLAVAEEAAETERSRRERAERALQESVDAVRDLQTQQAHIELARDEALQALKRSAGALESLHAALRSHQEQLAAMQEAVEAGERAVRAGSAALSAERAARMATEAALREAAAARQPPGKRAREASRAAAGSSARGAKAKPSGKPGRPRKLARKPVAASGKPKRRQSAAPKRRVTPARKNVRGSGKRRD
jgi:hypothetical protein